MLNRLDANRIPIDAKGAGRLAGSRANAAGKFREVVCGVQHLNGVFPIALKYQFIKVWNDVVDWAAVIAKRNTAIHAARTLDFGLVITQRCNELFVVVQARYRSLVGFLNTLKLHKSSDLTHLNYSFNIVLLLKQSLLHFFVLFPKAHPMPACIRLGVL